MDREKAKNILQDLTLGLRNTQMDTMLALGKRNFIEAQECYKGARAELAGARATIAALEVCSNKEMDVICKNTMKHERTVKGLFTEWFSTSRQRIAWRSFFFPVIHAFPIILYFELGFCIGGLIYSRMN